MTIPAGSLQTTINVAVNTDDEVEPDEQFSVTIASVTGADAVIGDDTGVATIVDADAVSDTNPAITVSSGSLHEGDQAAPAPVQTWMAHLGLQLHGRRVRSGLGGGRTSSPRHHRGLTDVQI